MTTAIAAQKEFMALGEPAQALPASVPTVTPMQMLQVAMERGADLDKMQQLMDLRRGGLTAEGEQRYRADLAVAGEALCLIRAERRAA